MPIGTSQGMMDAPYTSSQLFSLPTELLLGVLSYLGPYDLAAFAATAKRANSLIVPSNQVLWRSAFLTLFDDPVRAWSDMPPAARQANKPIEDDWDWYLRLREWCTALRAVTTNDEAYRKTFMQQSTDVLVHILENARHRGPEWKFSRGGDDDDNPHKSRSICTLERAFRTSRDGEKMIHSFEPALLSPFLTVENDQPPVPYADRRVTRSMMAPAEPPSENSSRLHVYYGVTNREKQNTRRRGAARFVVYDCRSAVAENDYGPFLRDGSGRIDWKVLEAVASLIGYIVQRVIADQMKLPQSLQHAIPNLVDINPEYPHDWAGVTRRWMGTYAFIDYVALHHFNTALLQSIPHSLDHRHEELGDLRVVELQLDDSIVDDPRLRTNLPVCKDLPVLYFSGSSLDSDNMHPLTSVRGTASLLPDGRHVRWRFIIRYGGADQWQLEGVQPGGIRSGGIFGRWTHCDHDEDGPIGPFCYFPEDLC